MKIFYVLEHKNSANLIGTSKFYKYEKREFKCSSSPGSVYYNYLLFNFFLYSCRLIQQIHFQSVLSSSFLPSRPLKKRKPSNSFLSVQLGLFHRIICLKQNLYILTYVSLMETQIYQSFSQNFIYPKYFIEFNCQDH